MVTVRFERQLDNTMLASELVELVKDMEGKGFIASYTDDGTPCPAVSTEKPPTGIQLSLGEVTEPVAEVPPRAPKTPKGLRKPSNPHGFELKMTTTNGKKNGYVMVVPIEDVHVMDANWAFVKGTLLCDMTGLSEITGVGESTLGSRKNLYKRLGEVYHIPSVSSGAGITRAREFVDPLKFLSWYQAGNCRVHQKIKDLDLEKVRELLLELFEERLGQPEKVAVAVAHKPTTPTRYSTPRDVVGWLESLTGRKAYAKGKNGWGFNYRGVQVQGSYTSPHLTDTAWGYLRLLGRKMGYVLK